MPGMTSEYFGTPAASAPSQRRPSPDESIAVLQDGTPISWWIGKAFLKFSDGSNRKVADEQLQPPVGTGRMFGPFQQVHQQASCVKDPADC